MSLIRSCPGRLQAHKSGKCELSARRARNRCRRRSRTAARSVEEAASRPSPPPPSAVRLQNPDLAFFPDRRCVEDVQLPPLASCSHYINLTNGIEAVPRLQAVGLPYRFLRLPSTRCEQQQFEALVHDLDSDLLMRLALGQCCLVHDFGSRNKKRGAPRAIWYGLEFVRYALLRLWLDERGPAYLRGHSVAHIFEQHVAAFSTATKKKVRYYGRYIEPSGLPQLRLYGVYAATARDGDQAWYGDLLRHYERGNTLMQHHLGAEEAAAAWQPPPAAADVQRRQALLHGVDTHAAVEQLLGMRIFMGDISHRQFHEWAARTGYTVPGGQAHAGWADL